VKSPYGYGPAPAGPYLAPPPPLSPAGRPPADFGARFLAYLIDSAILTVAALILAVGPGIAVRSALLPRLTDGTDQSAAGPVPPEFFFLIGLGVEAGVLHTLHDKVALTVVIKVLP
jgi:uncharacterized RDD family membrane protein YckC